LDRFLVVSTVLVVVVIILHSSGRMWLGIVATGIIAVGIVVSKNIVVVMKIVLVVESILDSGTVAQSKLDFATRRVPASKHTTCSRSITSPGMGKGV
jgi:hypothetical protein